MRATSAVLVVAFAGLTGAALPASGGQLDGLVVESVISDVAIDGARALFVDGTVSPILTATNEEAGLIGVAVSDPAGGLYQVTVTFDGSGNYKAELKTSRGGASFVIDIPYEALPYAEQNRIDDVLVRYFKSGDSDPRPSALRLAFADGEIVRHFAVLFCHSDWVTTLNVVDGTNLRSMPVREGVSLVSVSNLGRTVSVDQRRGQKSFGPNGAVFAFADGTISYSGARDGFYADPYWVETSDGEAAVVSIVSVDNKSSAVWITSEREGVGTNGTDLLVAYDPGVVDVIRGLAGGDTIYGFSGDDYLLGGAGNDVLVGEGGFDTLVGGEGADIFAMSRRDFSDSSDDLYDTIEDFDPAEGDLIDLSTISLAGLAGESLRLAEHAGGTMLEGLGPDGWRDIILFAGVTDLSFDVLLDHLMLKPDDYEWSWDENG